MKQHGMWCGVVPSPRHQPRSALTQIILLSRNDVNNTGQRESEGVNSHGLHRVLP